MSEGWRPAGPRAGINLDMRLACAHASDMSKMVQIRNVPDGLHRKLKARAADSGRRSPTTSWLNSTSGGAAHARGDAGQTPQSKARDPEDSGRGRHPRGARVGVIVVDASALLEFLLQTSLGARVEARLFREDELAIRMNV